MRCVLWRTPHTLRSGLALSVESSSRVRMGGEVKRGALPGGSLQARSQGRVSATGSDIPLSRRPLLPGFHPRNATARARSSIVARAAITREGRVMGISRKRAREVLPRLPQSNGLRNRGGSPLRRCPDGLLRSRNRSSQWSSVRTARSVRLRLRPCCAGT